MKELIERLRKATGPWAMADVDMASDAAWEPVFSPYHGKIMPAWEITQEARWRMGYFDPDRTPPIGSAPKDMSIKEAL